MIAFWQAMTFREPLWLLLALQPIVFMSLARMVTVMRSTHYADAALLPWVRVPSRSSGLSHYLRMVFFYIAWLLLAIAMAGPRLPESIADQHTRTQRQLMVLLDISPSMSTRDVQPNRLQRAKLELLDLIDRMQGTRMGIIVYGARAHVLSPLTHDKAVLRHYVNAIRTKQLPTLGSRLARAIELAHSQLKSETNHPRALLIISDGDYHTDQKQQTRLAETISRLRQHNIRLYALGVGTGYGAPVMAEDGGWLQYEGQAVNSRLHSHRLQGLTQLGNGRYSDMRDSNQDWQTLYDDGIGRLKPVKQTGMAEQVIWHDHYHGFLLGGFLCLLLGLWQPSRRRNSQLLVLAFAVFIAQGFSSDTYAGETYYSAYTHLQNQNYAQARQVFSRLAGYAARLGEGNAAYHMQDYRAAAQQFTQALLDATDDQQRGQALFNLANCRYRLNDYQAAAQLYRDVMRYLPDHQGAMTNLEYAKALQRDETRSDRIAHRAGRGAQTGHLPDGVSTEGVRGMALGDDEDQTFMPPNIDKTKTHRTTQALKQAQSASPKVDQDTDTDWRYRIGKLEQLQRENPRIESDSAVFWQRLFEQEEGFLAPVEQAYRLPGVKPW